MSDQATPTDHIDSLETKLHHYIDSFETQLHYYLSRIKDHPTNDMVRLVESIMRERLEVLDKAVRALRAPPETKGWQPIATAPKDNERLLYLARIDDDGNLRELDFDGTWLYEEESWELSHINYWYWASANGIDEPTHWAYQDAGPPPHSERQDDGSSQTDNS